MNKRWFHRYGRWIPEELAKNWVQVLTFILDHYHEITWIEKQENKPEKERQMTALHAMLFIHLLGFLYEKENTQAFPSQKTLAKKMGCSEQKIQRLIADLKQTGLEVKRPNYNTTNRYQVGEIIDRLLEKAGFPVEEADKIPPSEDEIKDVDGSW